MKQMSRRVMLQMAAWGTAVQGWVTGARSTQAESERSKRRDSSAVIGNWEKSEDRVWLGPEFWATPMEDWKRVNGPAR